MSRPWKHRGFGLIELLIAVAITALLAAIALPPYAGYVARSRRGAARSTLVQSAQWLERVATVTGRYPVASEIPPGLLKVEGGSYRVTVENLPTAFTLVATPIGSQADDRCGTLKLLQTGERQTTHAAPDTPLDACWGR